jgi:hypothetical protein
VRCFSRFGDFLLGFGAWCFCGILYTWCRAVISFPSGKTEIFGVEYLHNGFGEGLDCCASSGHWQSPWHTGRRKWHKGIGDRVGSCGMWNWQSVPQERTSWETRLTDLVNRGVAWAIPSIFHPLLAGIPCGCGELVNKNQNNHGWAPRRGGFFVHE